MSRYSRGVALAALAAVIASSAADARNSQNNAGSFTGARNSLSEMDVRQKCYAEAKERWSSTSQDVQTNRDFAYRTCAFDHGVRNP